MKRFNEDRIRRSDLPADVFSILHDLAYYGNPTGDWKADNMIKRAQEALMQSHHDPSHVEYLRRYQ